MPLEVTMCQMKSCILHIHGVLGPGCILRTGVCAVQQASFMALRCVSQTHRLTPDWAPERLTPTYRRQHTSSQQPLTLGAHP